MGALSPQRSDLTTRINLSPHPPNILFSVSPEGKEKKAQKQKGWLGQQSVRVFNWLDKALPIPVPPLTLTPGQREKAWGWLVSVTSHKDVTPLLVLEFFMLLWTVPSPRW